MGWFSSAVKWVKKKVVTPVVSGVTKVVDTVGDFVDGALEAGGNIIQGLANTKFQSSGTLNGGSGKDLLLGIEFKSIGKFLELSFTTLFSKDFWTSGTLPDSVKDFAGGNNSGLTVNGNGGDDTIFTFGGSVTQNGGDGADRMLALGGVTNLNGGNGNDFIVGASLVKNTIDGGNNNDVIIALGAINNIKGGSGNDVITAFGGANIIDAGSGTDIVTALAAGGNSIWGRSGNDILVAAGGANFIRGNEDRDTIAAGGAANFLYGGGHNDTIIAIGGGNWIYGDADNGNALGSGANQNTTNPGNDVIVSFGIGNFIWAEQGDDIVSSFGGGTKAKMGAGDDIVFSLGGGNFLFGEDGEDIVVGVGSLNGLFGGNDDDVVVSFGSLDLARGGSGDDIVVSVGPTVISFLLGDQGQDIIVAVGGSLRIMFGDDPFAFAAGGDGDDEAKRDGLLGFAEQTFIDFQFTDFEFEDLSLPTLPTLDDLDEGAIDVLENFVLGTWEGLKGVYGALEQIPSLFNGDTLSLDRLETAFTAIELPGFSKPNFDNLSLSALSPFNLGNLSFDSLDGFFSPLSPNYDPLEDAILGVEGIEDTQDPALASQSLFTPTADVGSISTPDANSLLPNLSTGFDPSTVGSIASYFPGESMDTSGVPDLGFGDLLDIDLFELPDADSLLGSVSDLKLPGQETLTALGTTLTGLFDIATLKGLFQPGEGRGSFSLPELSLPNLSVPSFDLYGPEEGDDSDIMVSVAGASLMFGQDDDDLLIGAGLMNMQFGGDGSDILAAIAKGNVLSGGKDDDIAVGIGLLNFVSGGEGSDILGAGGKFNIVAGGTDGDILVAGGLGNLMLGGSGADIVGGAGKLNIVSGGAENDILIGGGKFNVSHGGAGDDLALGAGTFNVMLGGIGGDMMLGGGKLNTMFGGEGNDTVVGGGKFNVIDGDLGDDVIFGGGKFNVLYGRSGNDAFVGGGKFNLMIGGQGTDLMMGGGKFNVFMSGTEADTDEQDHDIVFTKGTYNTFLAGGGDDLAIVGGELNHIYMGSGQDVILGISSNLNLIFAQEDADLVFGSGVGNIFSGGSHNDLMFGFGRPEEDDSGVVNGQPDIRSDGSVDLKGDWGDDLMFAYGNSLFVDGGEGQDKLWSNGALSFLTGGGGYDTLISLNGVSVLDGGDGNDIILARGVFPGSNQNWTQLVLDGGDIQGGKGSDLIWANGTDIEIFGDVGVSILNPEEAPDVDDGNPDTNDGADYIIVSGRNSQAYGQGGDDAMMLFGKNHRAFGGDGDDVMIAFGPDTELNGGDGEDELINLGSRIARSSGGAGDDVVLGKGFALLSWLDANGVDVAAEFAQNVQLLKDAVGEMIGNAFNSVTAFRDFDGSQITSENFYTGRDGLGELGDAIVPTEEEIRDAEIDATTDYIFTLIDEYGVDNLGSFLAELNDGNVVDLAPSYDTLAGDVTQLAESILSPVAGVFNVASYIGDMPIATFVLGAPLAPIYQGGDDNDLLGARSQVSSLLGGEGDDVYVKGVGDRITIVDEEFLGGDDTLIISAQFTWDSIFSGTPFGLSNLVFEQVDARLDDTADDLLIRVLSDDGDIRSVTILLDQYNTESAIETLTLVGALGDEVSFDLSTLMPNVETEGATVDGDALRALIEGDEAELDVLLGQRDGYNGLFLYDDFEIIEDAQSDEGEDIGSFETILDTYFETLGEVEPGGSSVVEARTLEEAFDGEAFDGAPTLTIGESVAQVLFDEGALLSIVRSNDEGDLRYDSTLTSNGSSVGLKDLHILPNTDVPIEAVAREDVSINLTGPDMLLTQSELEAEFLDLGFTLAAGFGLADGNFFGNVKIEEITDNVDAAPIIISGVPFLESDPDGDLFVAVNIDAANTSGKTVQLQDVDLAGLTGAVAMVSAGNAQVLGDDAVQTVFVEGNNGDIALGDGEDVFEIVLGGTADGDNSILKGQTGSDVYRFTGEVGAALAGTVTIAYGADDVIDVSNIPDDVLLVPQDDGFLLQNDTGALHVVLTPGTDTGVDPGLPSLIWTDGVIRKMKAGEQASRSLPDGDYALLVTNNTVNSSGTNSLDASEGNDLIIINATAGSVSARGGDDTIIFTTPSEDAGSYNVRLSAGNDQVINETGWQDVDVSFPGLRGSSPFTTQAGLYSVTLTHNETGDVTIIEQPVNSIFLGEQSITPWNDIQTIERAFVEDTPDAVFATSDDLDIPNGAETVNVRYDATAGTFVTDDGRVILPEDSLTVEEFLSLVYVPVENFNTGAGFFELEAEFVGPSGLLSGAIIQQTVVPVLDLPVLRWATEDPTSVYTFNEGEVPDILPLILEDVDGITTNKEFGIAISTTTSTGVVLTGGVQDLQSIIADPFFFLDENDHGSTELTFFDLETLDNYTVAFDVLPVDDLERFDNVPVVPIDVEENRADYIFADLGVSTVDFEDNIYEVEIVYEGLKGFAYASWPWTEEVGGRLHPDGAVLSGYYDSIARIETRTLTGTIEQINSAIGEVRVSGNRNLEGIQAFDIALYKVESDGTRSLQEDFVREVNFTKGINQVVAEDWRELHLTLDTGPVEIEFASPFDEDYDLDNQPVFPVRIHVVPEYGHLELPDGTVIEAGAEVTSDDLTSLIYVPDPDGFDTENDQSWAYSDWMAYLVYNPLGSTTVGDFRATFRVYDDKQEVDDGNGGTTAEPVGHYMYNYASPYKGSSNAIFFGGIGDDTINPYNGIDMMLGGGGSDTFIVDENAAEFNVIGDFELGVDILDFGDLSVVDIAEEYYFEDLGDPDDASDDLIDDTLDTVLTLSNGSILVLEDIVDFIENQNVAPDGADDAYAVDEYTYFVDEPTSVTGNVAGNDTDRNGDVILVDLSSVIDPSNGTLDIQEDGTFTYTPDRHFAGTDTFTYRPTDGENTGTPVTVTINVLDDPNNGDASQDDLATGDVSGALAGNIGFDTLTGGLGDDTLVGGAEADVITTGEGADVVIGTVPELDGDIINDFSEPDVIVIKGSRAPLIDVSESGGNTILTIDSGAEVSELTLMGTYGAAQFVQTINADGDTELRVVAAMETLLSAGADRLLSDGDEPLTIYSGDGNDAVKGGAFGDLLVGGSGADALIGGGGNDTIIGGSGQNALTGGEGEDIFSFDITDFNLHDPLVGVYQLIRDFTPGEDIIELSGFGDTTFEDLEFVPFIYHDVLFINGQALITLESVDTSLLTVDDFSFTDIGRLSALQSVEGRHILTSGNDTFVVADDQGSSVDAKDGDDLVLGGLGDDNLVGGLGDDTLLGREGEDTLAGGAGSNELTGGANEDTFVIDYVSADPGQDIITDFTLGIDSIEINGFPGISVLEDIVRTDTPEGLSFDLGGGRTLVLAGYSSTEEFNDFDIKVTAGPLDAASAPPLAAGEADTQSDTASDDTTISIRAWTVPIGDFEAARNLGFNFTSFELSEANSVLVRDADNLISPETADQTSVQIGDDDQGPVTDLYYHRITQPDENGDPGEIWTVAVLSREATADYLIIPIDVANREIADIDLPVGTPIKSYGGPTISGPVSLVPEVILNGGILARDDVIDVYAGVQTVLDVLANDEDATGDALQIQSFVPPVTGGSVSLENNTLTFTSDEGFIGVTQIEYTITDGTGLADTALVEIYVAPAGFELVTVTPEDGSTFASAATEYFQLFDGDLAIYGDLNGLNGDVIDGVGQGDLIRILGTNGMPYSLSILEDRTYVTFQEDGSDVSSTFALLGDYSDESFSVRSNGRYTDISIAGSYEIALTPEGERFITRDDSANYVFGDAGEDVIATAGGRDLLAGGAGSDLLLAGDGNDILIGGAGSDNLTGGADSDRFAFDAGDFEGGGFIADYINDFTPGSDKIELSGFDIDDVEALNFVTVASGDAIDLGNGRFIVLRGLSADDLLPGDIQTAARTSTYELISAVNTQVLTEAADRFISSATGPTEIYGMGGEDALIAGSNNDLVNGGNGSDLIIGGSGDDTIIGGQGSDVMTGRAGADRFEFSAGEETSFAADYINDFELGSDVVALTGFGLSSVEDLTWTTVGTGVAVQLAPTHFLVFEGYTDEAILEANTVGWSFG